MAQQKVGLKLNVARADLPKVLAVLPAMKAPTISPLADEDWVAIEVIVDELQVRDLSRNLRKQAPATSLSIPSTKSCLECCGFGKPIQVIVHSFPSCPFKKQKGQAGEVSSDEISLTCQTL